MAAVPRRDYGNTMLRNCPLWNPDLLNPLLGLPRLPLTPFLTDSGKTGAGATQDGTHSYNHRQILQGTELPTHGGSGVSLPPGTFLPL